MHFALTRYESLSPTQQRQLLDIELLPEQIRHVGDIHGGLHTLTARPVVDRQGFVLLIDDIPRGFFVLKRRSLLPDWARDHASVTTTLHALMIDNRFQGQGLGKQCLRALPELTQQLWPDTEQLMLAVETGNHPARQLYLALGWQELPERDADQPGFERLMLLTL
ncbi:GNAT family N-acetyltransferase [Pseudomonas sp. KU26590]|uniref:GNAT family N-acetyltransferase n=1 Tax=Pseudomonas sp. KU26590 TaxID=2991051 RepID=UPI00223D5EE6|nr:GNAT family N-acetyltransferase [Pseudomonas sp. KU26590]UZJ62152.1 GNAT family N-acetyltransferase [Pseudomonas sp. KU26590]